MVLALHEKPLARSALYQLLSAAFLYPENGTLTGMREGVYRAMPLASKLEWRRVEGTLQRLGRHLQATDEEQILHDYLDVFGHTTSPDCPPYEGEYGQAHIFQKSHVLADLQGFYKAFGVEISPVFKDRPDHLSVELEFMHLLALKEAYALLHQHDDDKVEVCQRAQESFLAMHLAPWAISFALMVAKKAGKRNVYYTWAHLLELHLTAECEEFQAPAATGALQVSQDPEEDLACEAEEQESIAMQQGGGGL
jgi:DMSO reductase family type II enzyme chaperone